jgi:hypothetical protein
LVIVHLNVTGVPAATLVTVVVGDVSSVITAPPPPTGETNVHLPVTEAGLVAAMMNTGLSH